MGDVRLIETAMVLRGAAPDDWDHFVRAMREYAAGATADMLKVPPEQLLKQQGVALGLHVVAALLRDAPQLYGKHLERTKNGRARADSRTEVWAEAPEADSGSG